MGHRLTPHRAIEILKDRIMNSIDHKLLRLPVESTLNTRLQFW
jgi:hypothetical protein